MTLSITDGNYLDNYERLQKRIWFQYHRFYLYWSILGIILVTLNLVARNIAGVCFKPLFSQKGI